MADRKRIIVSIGGGYASGIHELPLQLQNSFAYMHPNAKVTLIDLEMLFLAHNDKLTYTNKDYDFDMAYDLLTRHDAKTIDTTNSADDKIAIKEQVELVLLYGYYALFDERINNLAQLKIYLDCDADERLVSIIRRRDPSSSMELTSIITEYMEKLRPEMQRYIEPTKTFADMIIPSANQTAGSKIIVDGILRIIDELQVNSSNSKVKAPVWDYQLEDLEIERERYYDLS